MAFQVCSMPALEALKVFEAWARLEKGHFGEHPVTSSQVMSSGFCINRGVCSGMLRGTSQKKNWLLEANASSRVPGLRGGVR